MENKEIGFSKNGIKAIRNKKDLPNVEGFKFFGVLKDFTIIECTVNKSKLGLHFVDDYKSLIGWFKDTDYINFNQQPKKTIKIKTTKPCSKY